MLSSQNCFLTKGNTVFYKYSRSLILSISFFKIKAFWISLNSEDYFIISINLLNNFLLKFIFFKEFICALIVYFMLPDLTEF